METTHSLAPKGESPSASADAPPIPEPDASVAFPASPVKIPAIRYESPHAPVGGGDEPVDS